MSIVSSNFFAGVISAAGLISSAAAIEVRTLAQDSQPKFIKDGATMTGLCIDIFRAIEMVDPDLKFAALVEFTPLPRSEATLLEGGVDVLCGLAPTQDRKEKFDVIDIALYTTHGVLAARKNEKAVPKSWDDIKKLGDDAVVLTVTQTVQEKEASAQSGLKVDAQAKNTSQNLQKLVNGRGRFIYHNDFALADEIKRDNLGDKVKILPVQMTTEYRVMIVSKKAAPEIKSKLTAALDKLTRSGELVKIFAPYKSK
ncbi:MAG: hypothetical protein RL571_1009 [Pseudomonadota bacterium]|jgi:ABC-type amino acid transport substrate-binding protein